MNPVIALLTDFGTRDPFVGVMKGVILSRCPAAAVVDLTHEIPPQRIEEAAFWLERCFRGFPEETVFVAVVDPGVGSSRAALVARAHGKWFVGPDNGVLAGVLELDGARQVRRIDPARLGLPMPSRTFHGRDVFSPVAAELASGRLTLHAFDARDVSDATSVPFVALPKRVPVVQVDRIEGTVVTVDRFGNLITNVAAGLLERLAGAVVEVGGARAPLRETYSDVESGALVALVNAFDVLEVAERDGDAAKTLGVGREATVLVRARPREGA
ncbi:MAG TPA: SAM-dependent chlorinase/fluorinase [Polyangiaceae bacterium]|jgi:hypothetical protein|nr:SAM-dependent chlorinase/fluorinase [Polyangiaceae bacterium]